MSLLEELWRRALTPTPVPEASVLLIIAGVALAGVVVAWPAVRMGVTVCHEAGHAVAATLTGRSLEGIRLHSDTSGLTISRGRATGLGVVVMLFAGYPAASAVGLLAAWVTGAGYAALMFFALVALLAVMLLKIRNVHGALVVLALGAGLGAVAWSVPGDVLVWAAYALVWTLLLAGPRPVLELAMRGRGAPQSDAAQLARLTRIPGAVWIALWLAVTVGALWLGTVWMLPDVVAALG